MGVAVSRLGASLLGHCLPVSPLNCSEGAGLHPIDVMRATWEHLCDGFSRKWCILLIMVLFPAVMTSFTVSELSDAFEHILFPIQ